MHTTLKLSTIIRSEGIMSQQTLPPIHPGDGVTG
jgi:hypothetical protein